MKSTMTLSELAALAAKVEGFERPTVVHCDDGCDGCDDRTWVFDNSPAALLMAVVACIARTDHRLIIGFDDNTVRVWQVEPVELWEAHHDCTPDGIARAALVALLRAHGVEVSDEP